MEVRIRPKRNALEMGALVKPEESIFEDKVPSFEGLECAVKGPQLTECRIQRYLVEVEFPGRQWKRLLVILTSTFCKHLVLARWFYVREQSWRCGIQTTSDTDRRCLRNRRGNVYQSTVF